MSSNDWKRFRCIAKTGGERERILKAELSPATKNGVKWETFLIHCKSYAGQEFSVTFGSDVIGSPDADWIAFGSPRLLSHK